MSNLVESCKVSFIPAILSKAKRMLQGAYCLDNTGGEHPIELSVFDKKIIIHCENTHIFLRDYTNYPSYKGKPIELSQLISSFSVREEAKLYYYWCETSSSEEERTYGKEVHTIFTENLSNDRVKIEAKFADDSEESLIGTEEDAVEFSKLVAY